MILTGLEIERERSEGRIHIEPFDAAFLTTNTYDLSLGDIFCEYESEVLDTAKDNPARYFRSPPQGLQMRAGQFLLGHSIEVVGSSAYVPIIHARSTTARLGLFVHVTADLIDIGSVGQITFQLYAIRSILLKPGDRIAQVSFWVPKGDIVLYSGKYQNSKGPRHSESHKDPVKEESL